MRKLILLTLFLSAALGINAYESGQVSLALGAMFSPLEVGTEFGEVTVDDPQAGLSHDAKLGKPGLGGELQALYHISPVVGVGLSFSDQYFAEDLSSGWYVNNHTRMRHYMALSHVFLTPHRAFKLYIPLAVGATQTDFVQDFARFGESKKHFKYTGFSYYVGLGVEKEISSHWNVGLEARYMRQPFHACATRDNGDHVRVHPRANFFSFALRAIYTL